MKLKIVRIFLIGLIMIPLLFQQSCKKQKRCGCGKDVIFTLDEVQVMISYDTTSNTVIFYPMITDGSTYYFCNPNTWIDSLKKLNTSHYLLLTGSAYYDCNYLYNSGNYGYAVPPVYQVDVTAIKVDAYGKK